jgi:hypothetical protein
MKKLTITITLIILLTMQITQAAVAIADPEFNPQGYRSKTKLILDARA